MPKIKLSALATDIKGKAGGSVFARNSGGLYFRDNPSGGGRKTPKWAAARSAFASLAGQWRNLTDAQKEAWNAAVDNYNTTGAFGDVRVPSGYELFMRLNGPLNKLGLPLLDVPQAPQPLPEIGNMSLTTITDFLFTPFHGYAPFGYGLASACSNVQDCDRPGMECVNGECVFNATSSIINSDLDLSDASLITYSGLFVIPESAFKSVGSSMGIFLTTAKSPTTPGLTFILEKGDAATVQLGVNITDGTNTGSAQSISFSLKRDTPVRFTVVVNPENFSETQFWVNQETIEKDNETEPASPLDMTSIKFDVLPKLVDDTFPILIQDSRLYTSALSTSALGKLIYGYSVDGALIHLGYEKSKTASFKNFGSLDPANFSSGPYNPSIEKTYPPQDFNVKPWLLLFSDVQGSANEILVFKTTNPASGGKIGNRVGYRRIGVKDWEGVQFFEFGTGFIDEFGAVINNSTIQVEVQTLNTETGQMSEATQIQFVSNAYDIGPNSQLGCQTDADCSGGSTCIDGTCVNFTENGDDDTPPRGKFKAGAELSKGVN
jgi:hypothetical protein